MDSMPEDTYPSTPEQMKALYTIGKSYPMPSKPPKQSSSYRHWRVTDWFHRSDYLYFHLQYGQHYRETVIQADYFGYVWGADKIVYLKINRETMEMTEVTKDDFDTTRGSRVNKRGFVEWFKDGEWK